MLRDGGSIIVRRLADRVRVRRDHELHAELLKLLHHERRIGPARCRQDLVADRVHLCHWIVPRIKVDDDERERDVSTDVLVRDRHHLALVGVPQLALPEPGRPLWPYGSVPRRVGVRSLELLPRRHRVRRRIGSGRDPQVHLQDGSVAPEGARAVERDRAGAGEIGQERVAQRAVRDRDGHVAVVRLEQHGLQALLVELSVDREIGVPGERGVLAQAVNSLARHRLECHLEQEEAVDGRCRRRGRQAPHHPFGEQHPPVTHTGKGEPAVRADRHVE
eukprot:6099450-Prymnesium_polylepis.1